MNDRKLISFDDKFRIRVLDADKHVASLTLQESCDSFRAQVDQLKDYSKNYIDKLEEVSKHIEAEKLRAIGLRNKIAALREERRESSNIAELKAMRQQELDNLAQEERSLTLVVEEQEAHIARLKGQAVG
jgi:intraflagellar transport protein 20